MATNFPGVMLGEDPQYTVIFFKWTYTLTQWIALNMSPPFILGSGKKAVNPNYGKVNLDSFHCLK